MNAQANEDELRNNHAFRRFDDMILLLLKMIAATGDVTLTQQVSHHRPRVTL